MNKENLEWRVLDIQDDGYVELISTPGVTTINMKIGRGYNNFVYVLNDIAQKLYGNTAIGAMARNIKVEDLTDKINPGYNYIYNKGYNGEYLKEYTVYGSRKIPSIWKKEIGKNNSIDGINNNGTLGRSEQTELIYEDVINVNSSMTYTNMYYNLNPNVRYNMKTVETKNSPNDSEIYYNLLVNEHEVSGYTFATRLILTNSSSSNNPAFGCNKGNGIYGSGSEYTDYTTRINPMRIIVKLPKSRINIQVGTGNQGDGWGIQ